MSVWLTIGYIAAVLVSVGVLVTVATVVVEKSKQCLVWLVRTWCCMDEFGRDWDGVADNGIGSQSRDTSPRLPRLARILPAPKRTPARQKMPSKKKPKRQESKDSGGASAREADPETPNLSLLSEPVVTRV